MAESDDTIVMEGVKLIYRNFSGDERQYNREGDRNFCVVLDEATAAAMLADGWNVKQAKPHEDAEEDELPLNYLKVKLSFKGPRPPKIVLVTSRGKTFLSEESVKMLDWAEITNVDLIVRPYPWDVQGKQGITPYLKAIYVTIHEDPLELKYAELDGQDLSV